MKRNIWIFILLFAVTTVPSWSESARIQDPSKKIDLSGNWRMSGRQTNVERSSWEADLVLHKNGTLNWKETKGANVGATRTGKWSYDGKLFEMSYQAPRSGLVEWRSTSVTKTTMRGNYTTPQTGPQPVGWGGVWSAERQMTPQKKAQQGDKSTSFNMTGTWINTRIADGERWVGRLTVNQSGTRFAGRFHLSVDKEVLYDNAVSGVVSGNLMEFDNGEIGTIGPDGLTITIENEEGEMVVFTKQK